MAPLHACTDPHQLLSLLLSHKQVLLFPRRCVCAQFKEGSDLKQIMNKAVENLGVWAQAQ